MKIFKITLLITLFHLPILLSAQDLDSLIENRLFRFLSPVTLPDSVEIISLETQSLETAGLFNRPTRTAFIAQAKLKTYTKMFSKIKQELGYSSYGWSKSIVNDSLFWENADISKFGSFLISEDELSSFNKYQFTTNGLPELLVQADGNQLATSPGSDNFRINLSQSYLMSLVNNTDIDVDASVFASSASNVFEKESGSHKTLNYAYGNYQNSLANIFNKVNSNNHLKDEEFMALLNLWNIYSSDSNYYVNDNYLLQNFRGLMITEDYSFNKVVSNDLTSRSTMNLNPIPFLKSSASVDFASYHTNSTNSVIMNVDVFITEPITASNFIKMPKPDRIAWYYNRETYDKYVKFTDRSYIDLNSRDAQVIYIKFGPLPLEENIANRIKVNFGHLEKEFRKKLANNSIVSTQIPVQSIEQISVLSRDCPKIHLAVY
ncbi:MAG: hypothetical protein RIC35_04295 [Marinoscillum sp.]